MSFGNIMKKVLPGLSGPSREIKEGNKWLRQNCKDLHHVKIMSIGNGDDADGEGHCYKDYFRGTTTYTISDVSEKSKSDLSPDVRSMPTMEKESLDCIFCRGVLEHVENFEAAFNEFTRILKVGGLLIIKLPFRKTIHEGQEDFCDLTEDDIKDFLGNLYEIIDMTPIGAKKGAKFPVAYWVKAIKTRRG